MANKFQTDVNSNYLKVSRSNSRLTSTLKKLLPKRKTNNNSEPNLGIYSNHKYIIRINENEEASHKIWNNSSDNHISQVTVNSGRLGRKPSFLGNKKVQRSNSVMPFMQKKMNRTTVEVGEGSAAGEGEVSTKEKFPWDSSQTPSTASGR